MANEQLVNELISYKNKYYLGKQTISDKEFDEKEEYLRKIDPNNDYFNIVGNFDVNNNFLHKVQMKSLNKVKSFEDLRKWAININCEDEIFVVMPKIDGMSCSLIYENGILKVAVTRGDGKKGKIIKHIEKIPNIPKKLTKNINIEIRGELVLPNDIKIVGNLRNIVAGMINAKTIDKNIDKIIFIPFSSVNNENFDTFSKELSFIEEIMQIKVINNTLVSLKEKKANKEHMYIDNFIASFEKHQFLLNYETDGIVLQINDKRKYDAINKKYVGDHHDNHNIAFKFHEKIYSSKIKNVYWNGTKHGKLIPIAEIEPVEIDNTMITKVSLYNLSNIKFKKYKINDLVGVIKANKIMPTIIKIISNGNKEIIIPKKCPFCHKETIYNGIDLLCMNEQCSEKNKRLIFNWLTKNGCANIGYPTISQLYDMKIITNIASLYDLTYDKMIKIKGFKDKKIALILESINKSKKSDDLRILSNIGIPNVSRKSLMKLKITKIKDFINRYYKTKGHSIFSIENDIIKWINYKDNKEYLLFLYKKIRE